MCVALISPRSRPTGDLALTPFSPSLSLPSSPLLSPSRRTSPSLRRHLRWQPAATTSRCPDRRRAARAASAESSPSCSSEPLLPSILLPRSPCSEPVQPLSDTSSQTRSRASLQSRGGGGTARGCARTNRLPRSSESRQPRGCSLKCIAQRRCCRLRLWRRPCAVRSCDSPTRPRLRAGGSRRRPRALQAQESAGLRARTSASPCPQAGAGVRAGITKIIRLK